VDRHGTHVDWDAPDAFVRGRPGGTVPPCGPWGTPARGGALRVHGGGAAPAHRRGAGGVPTRDLRARTDAGPDRPSPGRGPVPPGRGRRPRGAPAVGAPDGGPARAQARPRSIQRSEEPPGAPGGHERPARRGHGGLPGDPSAQGARGPLVVPAPIREPGDSPPETYAVRPRFPGSGFIAASQEGTDPKNVSATRRSRPSGGDSCRGPMSDTGNRTG
jgi:hypothetical protein